MLTVVFFCIFRGENKNVDQSITGLKYNVNFGISVLTKLQIFRIQTLINSAVSISCISKNKEPTYWQRRFKSNEI